SVPNLIDPPVGCRFAPRCAARIKHGLKICNEVQPTLEEVKAGHLVRCWLYTNAENHRAPLKAR
ncbi:MAG TPA: oligopeptide/dipeptide ABC transporter ATP-binding protein, partial [Anaerolineales bacterium]|nr:oligopeptide/dipeptide ABC transporter ATP-binding protein [Anaerolineales bacterium]